LAARCENYADFGTGLKDFLHAFEFARRQRFPLNPMLAEAPPRLTGRFTEGLICDAFLAATADYLSRVNRIPSPEWALAEDLALPEPWFSEEFPAVRLRLLRDTPSAFKDKNLFVFESALSVV
jgi:hypothetical protein